MHSHLLHFRKCPAVSEDSTSHRLDLEENTDNRDSWECSEAFVKGVESDALLRFFPVDQYPKPLPLVKFLNSGT